MIILATIFLNIGHPGLIFDPRETSPATVIPTEIDKTEQDGSSSSDEARQGTSATV
jgi:hypothetical protein